MKTVLQLKQKEIERIISFYQDYMKENNNPSVLFMAQTEFITVTVYNSFKVQFQGSDALPEFNMWVQMLGITIADEPLNQKNEAKPVVQEDYYLPSIGSDEVGTGDFFGPITVCAAYLDENSIGFIKSLGIKDSKKLTDATIIEIAEVIKEKITFSLLTLHNDKFNELHKKGFNMNKMKAYLHNKAIINLLGKLDHEPKVILDQFAEKGLYYRYLEDEKNVYRNMEFYTKAEDKFASVALGSILARYAFLKHFDLLSDKSGYHLLKGANAKVDQLASRIIKEKGESFLNDYAKMNFKTLDKAKALIKLTY